jgi:2,3-bisphosphoglycerate-independent phosphoglycerate mutase
MKYILVIGDGMADNPVDSLGGKTPLEYANIPTIDRLAQKGLLGSTINCPKGLPPGSDTAILSIFGQDPNVCYTGRSPLEAAATGIALQPGDVSYRCNMVTLEEGDKPFSEKKILSHSGGSIDGESSVALVEYLFADPEFAELAKQAGMKVYPALSFRHIAVQSGANITGIKLIPPHDHLGEVIGPLLPQGCDNAKILLTLMEKANQVLENHPINEARRQAGKLPANGIWFWAEGSAVALSNFKNTYGHYGSVISAVPLCGGIARLTGLAFTEVEGATGELETNYEGKVQAALAELKKPGQDFVAIHVEAPDECTHNGDLPGKLQAIEWLDSRVVGPLTSALDAAGEDYRILILSDHKTLTSTRGHDGDPVPFLIYDSTASQGSGLTYTEKNGLTGPLVPAGTALMGMLFQQ